MKIYVTNWDVFMEGLTCCYVPSELVHIQWNCFCLCPIVEVCIPLAFGVNIPKSSIIKWKWHIIMFSGDSLVMTDFPVLRRLIYGFRERLNASRNSLVICLVNSVAWSSSGLRQKWENVYICSHELHQIFFKPCDVCKMLFIYNRILLIFLLNAVSNCALHAFHVYFPHVLFSLFFVILHYHCILCI